MGAKDSANVRPKTGDNIRGSVDGAKKMAPQPPKTSKESGEKK